MSLQTPSSAQTKLQMNQMFNSTAGTSSTQGPTERERELSEQDSDSGRTAKQASIAEMRGLQTITLTGFWPKCPVLYLSYRHQTGCSNTMHS